jgi:hypothetical protein
VLYRYKFAKPGNTQGLWWNREQINIWIQPTSSKDERLVKFLKSEGWIP